MERHHFSHTTLLLRHENINLFIKLDSKTYGKVLAHMKHVILATDLERHFPNLSSFKLDLLGAGLGSYSIENEQHRKMLSALIISACDLSSSCKPWDVQEPVAYALFDEFFAQGDEEKASGQVPIPMFDREVANIPEMEVGFLTYVAAPTYDALAEFCVALRPMADYVASNLSKWKAMVDGEEEGGGGGGETEMPTHLPTL